jgi:molybdate transport system regulatory protein
MLHGSIGPGKADLLEAVAGTGSIAAAGRALGLSYRRTRDMIDTLNACWRIPLVETVKGGRAGGGTTLTPAGRTVLKRYRALQAAIGQEASSHAGELLALAGPASSAKLVAEEDSTFGRY